MCGRMTLEISGEALRSIFDRSTPSYLLVDLNVSRKYLKAINCD